METPIKLERERRGIIQNEVADAVGIDRTHYSRIERGEASPSIRVAKKIAAFFGKPITLQHVTAPEEYVPLPQKAS